LFAKGGERLKKGLHFTHKYPFLAIHAKGGESIAQKQKDRTTTPISKKFRNKLKFLKCFQLVSLKILSQLVKPS
jgi:hypothetical protein